jgi:hypothetical protein
VSRRRLASTLGKFGGTFVVAMAFLGKFDGTRTRWPP